MVLYFLRFVLVVGLVLVLEFRSTAEDENDDEHEDDYLKEGSGNLFTGKEKASPSRRQSPPPQKTGGDEDFAATFKKLT